VSPRFTGLMPTHYRPDVIGFAIQSVLNQSETDFELFIVGDGARPETAAAVGRFTDPRIRWFDLPKTPGFGYVNRNIALRESRGELIAFAADDDLMSRPLGIARRGA
jgi:glycosyltransferase involved in cell wall biosynthesis